VQRAHALPREAVAARVRFGEQRAHALPREAAVARARVGEQRRPRANAVPSRDCALGHAASPWSPPLPSQRRPSLLLPLELRIRRSVPLAFPLHKWTRQIQVLRGFLQGESIVFSLMYMPTATIVLGMQ
jgi:hypothetical protein